MPGGLPGVKVDKKKKQERLVFRSHVKAAFGEKEARMVSDAAEGPGKMQRTDTRAVHGLDMHGDPEGPLR